MRPLYIRFVSLPVLQPGNFRSLPSEIGSSAGGGYNLPVQREFPSPMSLTVDPPVEPAEPGNDATLVPKFRLE